MFEEREMVVTGGLALWQGFAAAACYDVEREREELRFYPLDRRLDNAFASRYETDARVLMLNTRWNKEQQ